MTPVENLRRVLEEHRFFQEMKPEHLDLVTGCTKNVVFADGEVMFRDGEPANTFFILRQGSVAVELDSPGAGAVVVQTYGEGEVLGWSWIIGPHLWRYTGRATKHTRALAIDGECLRTKCEENHDLGYDLLKRVAGVISHRLEATRLQLLDLYSARS